MNLLIIESIVVVMIITFTIAAPGQKDSYGADFIAVKARNQHAWLLSTLSIIVALLITWVAVQKIYDIVNRGPEIGPEVIGRTQLNPLGVEIKRDLQRDERSQYVLCLPAGDDCKDEKQREISAFVTSVWDYIHSDPLKETSRLEWVTSNDLSMEVSTLFRGRVLHHYSAVLWPYYYAKQNGLWTAAASQYGALMSLQYFVLPDTAYYSPALLAWSGLIILFLYLVGRHVRVLSSGRKYELFAILVVGALVATVMNTRAVIMSPGFSPLRYLPTAIMIFAYLYHRGSRTWLFLFILAAVLNSLQFNILFACLLLLVTAVRLSVSALSIDRELRNKIVLSKSHLILLLTVVLFQLIVFRSSSDDFPTSLFASLSEQSAYGRLVLLLYGLCISAPALLALFFAFRSNIPQSSSEVDAVMIFVGFAQYAATFYGSPQHLCGFLLMTSPALVCVLSAAAYKGQRLLWLCVIPLFGVIIWYKFWSLPGSIERPFPDIYVQERIGQPSYFNTASDTREIQAKISHLGDGVPVISGRYYFLIREKFMLELANGTALAPAIYDSFTNLDLLNESNLETYISEYDYVVTYSEVHINALKDYLEFAAGNIVDENEVKSFIYLLDKQKKLMDFLGTYASKCDDHYCVYRVRKVAKSEGSLGNLTSP